MTGNTIVLKGNICYSENLETIKTVAHGFLVCIDGICQGVFEKLPEKYAGIKIQDYQDQMIIPGLTDLHVHGPQFSFHGMHMDLQLIDWLNTYTFPEEGRFSNLDYAKEAYSRFVEDLINGPNTRSVIFATRHTDATILLMDLLEEAGYPAYVGRVSMDRNAPEYLCESDAESAVEEERRWIADTRNRYTLVKPILTPRFVPSCSDELLAGLSKLQQEYHLPVQSHLSENKSEISWVADLCPWSRFYGDAYDHYQLFGQEKTVMAHCVHSPAEEVELMKKNGVYIAHCPQSNTNLSSGIAPVREYLDKGLKVGLGSDVAGGCHTSILRAMADAIQVSKLRFCTIDDKLKPLTMPEAFYLGTLGGGAFFGNVGSFLPGYEMDAVIIDDSSIATARACTLPERLERLIYLSERSNVAAKYIKGRKVK